MFTSITQKDIRSAADANSVDGKELYSLLRIDVVETIPERAAQYIVELLHKFATPDMMSFFAHENHAQPPALSLHGKLRLTHQTAYLHDATSALDCSVI